MRYLIWSTGHGKYWLPDQSGYTQDPEHAGRYSAEEVGEICGSRNFPGRPDPIYPVRDRLWAPTPITPSEDTAA